MYERNTKEGEEISLVLCKLTICKHTTSYKHPQPPHTHTNTHIII